MPTQTRISAARAVSLLLGLGLLAACAAAPVESFVLAGGARAEAARTGVRLLGALALAKQSVDGLPLSELSGLAWDEDEGVLYALSDQGTLFHLRPEFSGQTLTGVALLRGYRLHDAAGRPLRGKAADAEGLALRNGDNARGGDSELLVAFERRPRLVWFRADGAWLREEPLPAELRAVENYFAANKSLEAVGIHPVSGILTAPELPRPGTAPGCLEIYGVDGQSWAVPANAMPGSGLTAMEGLPDGSLLLLERAYLPIWQRVIISLRRVELTAPTCAAALQDPPLRQTAVLDSGEGWRVDNFEGLARYRDNRFFMVSDDNASPLQKTLLVHFELPPAARER